MSPLLLVGLSPARADIFQWEYIDPVDPSQGKQQSTTLAPDGAGVDAVPGADLSSRDLTMAYLIDADLTDAWALGANLTNADLSQANLTNANFGNATLTGADFAATEVRGANFANYVGTGITLAQLYSTASYQARALIGIGLDGSNLTNGDFAGRNLTDASLARTTLTGADFCGANLTNAFFWEARLTDVNLTDAQVQGAHLGTTGITLPQLYSTASYRAHLLTGIVLGGNDLSGANFAGQNLTNADLSGATLSDANFSQANLTNAALGSLAGANFTGATVRGASLSGLTLAQLYSTASYLTHDLSNINVVGNDLAGGNFALQNLTNANFRDADLTGANFRETNLTNAVFGAATLTGANFRGANLANAVFADYGCDFMTDTCMGLGAGLTGADLTAADARGSDVFAHLYISVYIGGVHVESELVVGEGAIATNLIGLDGVISGLDLNAGGLLVVRDYDGNPSNYNGWGDPAPIPPIPITVDQHLNMAPGGTLRIVFEADAWDSTISFAPGIPVTLGGTLELTFADDVNLASQVGRTFDLFDWTGVHPTGVFTVASRYVWDFSSLYTTGDVRLLAIPDLAGDFNHDGTVDAADYVVWRKNFSGDQTMYDAWRTNFGRTLSAGSGSVLASTEPLSAAVPEPRAMGLAALGAAAIAWFSRRRVGAWEIGLIDLLKNLSDQLRRHANVAHVYCAQK
jgi:uncharacterized protein YjbI with pentapeptide repeats